jgi:hypothetical protein
LLHLRDFNISNQIYKFLCLCIPNLVLAVKIFTIGLESE